MDKRQISRLFTSYVNEPKLDTLLNQFLDSHPTYSVHSIDYKIEEYKEHIFVVFDVTESENSYMTSNLGLLPINSEGLRKAVDKISELEYDVSVLLKENSILLAKVGKLINLVDLTSIQWRDLRVHLPSELHRYIFVKFEDGSVQLESLDEVKKLARSRDYTFQWAPYEDVLKEVNT